MNEGFAKSILFIDDNCNEFMGPVSTAANSTGFKIFGKSNVADGIEFLEQYKDIVDAIVLDIFFPNSELQGDEALIKIKQEFPDIPVIMFSDSNTADDINRVVSCIKNGAYNFVGKKSLSYNPKYLIQVVEGAVSENELRRKLKAKAIEGEKNKNDFFISFHPYAHARFNFKAMFGFELISVNKPYTDSEKTQLSLSIMEWHGNFLQTLNGIYRDEINVTLKYNSEQGQVRCNIIFSVHGETEKKLNELILNIQQDLRSFFILNKNIKHFPYLFKKISDEKYLNSASVFNDEFKYNLFQREAVIPYIAKSVGFTRRNTSGENENLNSVEDENSIRPEEIMPMEKPIEFSNEFFNALCNQKAYTEISVNLSPGILMKEEIDFIRSILENSSVSFSGNLNGDYSSYRQFLAGFLSHARHKFYITVVLKKAGELNDQHLKHSICNYFFGNGALVSIQPKSSEEITQLYTPLFIFKNRLPFFYSVTGAAQAFRLPIPGVSELAGILEQPSVYNQLPDNLSSEGVLLGEKNMLHHNKPIRISTDSIARHLYVMGQTGTGKSTLLKTMIADCVKNDSGFTVIDPHGDLYDEVLKIIPKNKQYKIKHLNITDIANSISMNPLQHNKEIPQEKSLVINEILRVFSKIYDMKLAGGPMFETYFKNGLLLIMDDAVVSKYGDGKLSDLNKIFTDRSIRDELLEECRNENVLKFFKTAQAMSGEAAFANIALYISSKLTRLVEDFYLEPIINGNEKNVSFRKLIDEKNILLVKLDKGLIGSDNASLMGQLILSRLILAGMSRSDININERTPHYIFIDEFQNFGNGDVGGALSEVRKYGLRMVLANQTLGQLSDNMIQSLLGNVGSLIFFRPGINDYEIIRHYIEPEFVRDDVLKLPNFNCIARLMINNVPSDPFVFQTRNEF